MSKPDMEQLEAGVATLIEVCRRLKDENDKLTLQMEGLIQKGESLANEKEFTKDKLERLSDLEMKNKKHENMNLTFSWDLLPLKNDLTCFVYVGLFLFIERYSFFFITPKL